MKILRLITFLLFTYCWCKETVIVVDLNPSNSPPEKDEKTILPLTENVEVSIPLTLCLRFNLNDRISARCAFTSKGDNLSLKLRFPTGLGKVHVNGESFYFDIPKDSGIRPFFWHHICVSVNEETYWVVVDGQQWSTGKHNIKPFQNISIGQFFLGSAYEYVEHWEDNFKGGLSELNIWNNALSVASLIGITEKCCQPKPVPDILQWANITYSMLTGENNYQTSIKLFCSTGKVESYYHKLIPHLQDQNGAKKTCKDLHGQLASPKTLNEYKSWHSKNFNIVFSKY